MAFALGVTYNPSLPSAVEDDSGVRLQGLCLGSHLSVVQASACAGRNAEDEIFQWRLIQNSFEIISEKSEEDV